jgi:O-antigen ligase/Tfp pilus assembly protein PilF
MLFNATVGRLKKHEDITLLIQAIGAAVIAMSGLGILQYYFPNNLHLWFYKSPYLITDNAAKGSFTCQNHFAHFLVLGIGPLLAWATLQMRGAFQNNLKAKHHACLTSTAPHITLLVCIGLVALAVLLSFSRGGSLALVTSSTIALAYYYLRGILSANYFHALLLLGLLVTCSLSLSDYDRIANELDDLTSASVDQLDSSEGRRIIWAANLAAIQEGSLFGSGAGSHREIYPVYLQESIDLEYTHAENGYLQIVTENGYLGAALLALAITMVGRWCWLALRHSSTKQSQILAGAITASLAASVVHSLVDFVWFIPSCMSVTLLLAACALRLAQLSTTEPVKESTLPDNRIRWGTLTALTSCAAIWSISASLGPAAASLHWDRYLLAATENHSVRKLQSSSEVAQTELDHEISHNKLMIFHLRNTLRHDPFDARAHLRLAGKYLHLFNQLQQASDNAMSIDQIRDATIASQFTSAKQLQSWLQQAFGKNSNLLYRAHNHTRQALRLCPLQGDGYLYLADLCFLEGHAQEKIDAYVEQGLKVRPYDGGVLFNAGRQLLLLGQYEQAFATWQKAYQYPGKHQNNIIQLLAKQMPAANFIELFNPNWETLRPLWRTYRVAGTEEDWKLLINQANTSAQLTCPDLLDHQAASIWFSLAIMQHEVGNAKNAISCIEQAYRVAPNQYRIRRLQGQLYLLAEQFQQAEPHLRWCMARHPEDTSVQRRLIEASKSRLSSKQLKNAY